MWELQAVTIQELGLQAHKIHAFLYCVLNKDPWNVCLGVSYVLNISYMIHKLKINPINIFITYIYFNYFFLLNIVHVWQFHMTFFWFMKSESFNMYNHLSSNSLLISLSC